MRLSECRCLSCMFVLESAAVSSAANSPTAGWLSSLCTLQSQPRSAHLTPSVHRHSTHALAPLACVSSLSFTLYSAHCRCFLHSRAPTVHCRFSSHRFSSLLRAYCILRTAGLARSMSTSRAMSRLLRVSSRPVPHSSHPASRYSALMRPASSLCSTSSLSSSSFVSSARRSFFSRTTTAADSQQQATASTSQQQSTDSSSTNSSTASDAPQGQPQTPQSTSTPSSNASATNGQTTASSSSTTQQADATSQLQQQLTQLQQQQKETYDRLLRTAAEMENLRRTTRIDVDNARKYATTGFAKSVLEVADTLELAGKSAREALKAGALSDPQKAQEVVQSLLEGVEMTERVLGKVLSDNGIVKQLRWEPSSTRTSTTACSRWRVRRVRRQAR